MKEYFKFENNPVSLRLPANHANHTDHYFHVAKGVLFGGSVNPYVRYQVFLRPSSHSLQGTHKIYGIERAIRAVWKFAGPHFKKSGRIMAVAEGTEFKTDRTTKIIGPVMYIDGYLRDLVDIETIVLSIISEETHRKNTLPVWRIPNLEMIKILGLRIKSLLDKSKFGARKFSYFGARHFGIEWDAAIADTLFRTGLCTDASTVIGADVMGRDNPVETTPHSLMLGFAAIYGKEKYMKHVMLNLNAYVGKESGVFLCDTFNKEFDDVKAILDAGIPIKGIRFDTHGGNKIQSRLPLEKEGVTTKGVHNVIDRLDSEGFNPFVVLSSGFSEPDKMNEFLKYEEEHDIKLFDAIGAGFSQTRYCATSDICLWFPNGPDNKSVALSKEGRRFIWNKDVLDVNFKDLRRN